jgi:hypothetical protein
MQQESSTCNMHVVELKRFGHANGNNVALVLIHNRLSFIWLVRRTYHKLLMGKEVISLLVI